MDRTGLPVAAGTINIIAGFFNLTGALGMLLIAISFTYRTGIVSEWHGMMQYDLNGFDMQVFFYILAVWLCVSGIFAIIGGAFALQRKMWGLALTGSIFVLLTSFALGVASLILIIISMKEFNQYYDEPMKQTIMPQSPYDQDME